MRSQVGNEGTVALGRSRVVDYLMLTKPELTFLAVLTALGGFYFGSNGSIHFMLLFHTMMGTALVGGGAGALNQYIERHYDALMRRTENRPLPAGRLAPGEVLVFGTAISLAGFFELTVFVNVVTGFIAALTIATYLFLYTPLKRIAPLATLVGAVPGALPPVMGWTAVRNEISIEAAILFGILFLWQIPHFLSLAWMYRKDYARAGYRLMTVLDSDGSGTSRHVLAYTVGLIPMTVLPCIVGRLGVLYLCGAMFLGGYFLVVALQFFRTRKTQDARRVFIVSLAYLPALVAFMVADKLTLF